ncbi:hypothetical protein CANMA_003627 [Candida margitis]|uniref:uncharacterized protein n=1 Tax=Candida margitis TaxID=1775924 RepID=UPI00222778C4|nr:uncharacterized protein CANMA_003627 [Candida margitis]KAI5962852.1 hypothetical protein CANMA_003627 [Candida margitis]
MEDGLDRIIVLHIGAGKHNEKSRNDYVKLMKKALKKGDIIAVNNILEHSSLTNTGYGSSLNILGEVEIDASYYKSNGESGALSGLQVDSPTQEMFRIFNKINDQHNTTGEQRLTRPVSLNCTSLKRYMDIPTNENLVSAKSKRIYDMYKDRILKYHGDEVINDTIGSIVIDTRFNHTALATTSGGHFFKLPGRIGCAGIVGAAIYYEKINDLEISCMCSGNGEQIIQTSLAQSIVKNVRYIDEGDYGPQLERLIQEMTPQIYCGFIVVLKRSNGRIQLLYGHTTESFYFGTRVHDATRVILSCAEQEGKFTFGEYKLR